jgi:DnaJ-class molecular chaperone
VDLVRIAASLLCPLLILITLGYAAVCAASPFGTCRRCSGTGRTGAARGWHSRPCRHCDATGIRIRLGRHLYHQANRVHRDGTR